MKKYEEYKDSGIEYIGKMPSHYSLVKLKDICENIGRGKSPEYEDNTGYYVVNQACLYWNHFKSDSLKSVTSKFYNGLKKNHKIKNGDILINSTGGGTLGKSAFFDKTGTLGRVHFYEGNVKYAYDSHVTMIRLKDGYNKKYFYYLFCSRNFHNYIDLFCVNGSTKQIELSKTSLESVFVGIPDIQEQSEIVKYLDDKTMQIEQLIDKKEELIKTLKASREKLISETVRQGIDKYIELKDSEVEYIGKIPIQYKVVKLKNICENIGRGKSPEYEENTGVYTVNQACLYWNYFKSESLKSVSRRFYNKLGKKYKIKKGDILINSTGGGNLGKSAFFDKTGTLGRVHFYEGEERYAYDSHVTMVRLNPEYSNKYFYYLFCTRNFHNYVDLFCVNGSTKQIELSKTSLESVLVAVPNKEEQDEIVKYLDDKTSKIDETVASIEEQIELFKKAKQKLITEVVTGKIDIRGEI